MYLFDVYDEYGKDVTKIFSEVQKSPIIRVLEYANGSREEILEGYDYSLEIKYGDKADTLKIASHDKLMFKSNYPEFLSGYFYPTDISISPTTCTFNLRMAVS